MIKMDNNFLGEIGLIVLGILLLIFFVPIFIGAIIALFVGVVGLSYYTLTLGIAALIWFILIIWYFEVI
ncbi:MAG: hypothetical protein IKT40_02070 [Bacilli bacterium]|nr:hypothetical protein [Bacilli bacterium]